VLRSSSTLAETKQKSKYAVGTKDAKSDVSISSTGSVTRPLKRRSDVKEIGSAAKKKKITSPMHATACTPATKRKRQHLFPWNFLKIILKKIRKPLCQNRQEI
jgi:hypothetical protein